MGVVGRPRDWSFRARFVGEFRQRPGQRFMPCEARQYNTSLVPARIYYMRIDFAGVLPMFGVDAYRARQGRMHGKLLGLVTVADGSGREFDIGELTTYVNDALMIAPVHAPHAGGHLDGGRRRLLRDHHLGPWNQRELACLHR
jgi:hypothetical protein